MDNATPEEARVVNESIAGVDWEALMAEEEAGLTLTRQFLGGKKNGKFIKSNFRIKK